MLQSHDSYSWRYNSKTESMKAPSDPTNVYYYTNVGIL